MPKPNKYDLRHQQNLYDIQALIDEIYEEAAREAARIGAALPDFDPDRLFSFADYPSTRKRVNRLLQGLRTRLMTAVVNGVKSAWTLANNKNDELCRYVFGDNIGKLSGAQYRRYFNNNETARDAFIARKTAGLNLSDRVWNYTNQFKREIELGLDVGIRQGMSADEMSRALRQYLKYPDKLFRRVREGVDSEGNPIFRLSRAASEFHPGQGVYRSSYKNARRLACTETNMAYRTADYDRWQQLDFVVGQLIEPSKTNHPVRDICDDLKGRYPKDFKFTGWHPHCRCHALSILKSKEEIMEDNQRILRGEEPTETSVNTVSAPPKGFENWVKDNSDRILYGKSTPYFLRDNPQYAVGAFPVNQQAQAWEKMTAPPELSVPKPQSVKPDYTPYQMTQAKLDELKKNGSIAPEITLQDWQNSALNGMNPDRLREEITAKAEEIGMTFDRVRYRIRKNSCSIRCDGNGWEASRMFYKESDGIVVEHSLFEVESGFQGKGFSKAVLRSFYEQYRALGVTQIHVHTNIDVGGYTWARYGFQAKSYDDVHFAINWSSLTDTQTKHISGLIDDWYKTHSHNSPFPIKKIADLTYGRKALLGRDWNGVIDLRDRSQREVFEKCLGL